MFASSLIVIIAGLALGVVSLMAFFWALFSGQFESHSEQAAAILDERDVRLLRAWETPAQQHEREAEFGPLMRPAASEWGGGL